MTDEEIQQEILDYLEKGACRAYLDGVESEWTYANGDSKKIVRCSKEDIDRNLQILIDKGEVIDCAPPEGPDWFVTKIYQPSTFDYEFGWKKWGKIIEEGDCIAFVKNGEKKEIQIGDIEFGERTYVNGDVIESGYDYDNTRYCLEDYDQVIPEDEDHKLERLMKEEEEDKKAMEEAGRRKKIEDNKFDDIDRRAREKVKSLGHDVVFGPGPFGTCVRCGKRVNLRLSSNSFDGEAAIYYCKLK